MIIFVKNTTMEKTAIEFIVKELIKLGYLHSSDYSQSPNVTKVIEQAKEMEKQQIVDSFKEGTKYIDINDEISAEFNAIIYYNETFNR